MFPQKKIFPILDKMLKIPHKAENKLLWQQLIFSEVVQQIIYSDPQ